MSGKFFPILIPTIQQCRCFHVISLHKDSLPDRLIKTYSTFLPLFSFCFVSPATSRNKTLLFLSGVVVGGVSCVGFFWLFFVLHDNLQTGEIPLSAEFLSNQFHKIERLLVHHRQFYNKFSPPCVLFLDKIVTRLPIIYKSIANVSENMLSYQSILWHLINRQLVLFTRLS